MNGNDRLVSMTVTTAGETHTRRLAAALAGRCRLGDCILLHGDLGSGKTVFARGFIQALHREPVEVVSPTFTLVQTYAADGSASVAHFDLYRLKSSAEATEIGLDDALEQGITLIEWPELVRDRLPAGALEVHIRPCASDERRTVALAGPRKLWQERLIGLQEEYS